jgi:predicted DNA-binding transcriptional regulator YafY
MDKAERLNQEMAWLMSHPVFNLKDIMNRFSVSRRTALRDIADLEELGLFVASEKGRAGGYHVISRGPLIPVTFTEKELSAIFFALHALKLISVNPFEQSYAHIYQKLLLTLPLERRERVKQLQRAAHYYNVEPLYAVPWLRQFFEACISRHIIRLQSPQIGEQEVSFEFLWLYYRNGLWFFEGIDVETDTWYRARCDRITSFEDTGKEGKYTEKELVAFHFQYIKEHHNIPFRCQITEEGREYFYRERYENIHLMGLEMTGAYNRDEIDRLIDYLLGYGTRVTILEPEELREKYIERLIRMLQVYEKKDVTSDEPDQTGEKE